MPADQMPPDTIERELFACPKARIFAVPPLASASKGHIAAQWTRNEPIFTARVRVVETSSSAATDTPVAVAVVLEDPASGELFAAAPYAHSSSVAACADSSRFFAVRVVGEGGRKATLGVEFEERAHAFDFNVALQRAARELGFSTAAEGGKMKAEAVKKGEARRDLGLKDGEMVTVNIGGSLGDGKSSSDRNGGGGAISLDTITPQLGNGPLIAPPPSAVVADKGGSINEGDHSSEIGPNLQNANFDDDDGEFGEFQ